MTAKIEIRGTVDGRAVEQLRRCADAGDATAAAICADGHVGYSQPIGGVVAYRDYISPSWVGYDIGCGNKAVQTNISVADLGDVSAIMDEIVARVSFGVGRVNDEPVGHEVLDHIRDANFVPQRGLGETAAQQLGTVGAGNHYVVVQRRRPSLSRAAGSQAPRRPRDPVPGPSRRAVDQTVGDRADQGRRDRLARRAGRSRRQAD
jgi:RNA-splicing ligase RtcB